MGDLLVGLTAPLIAYSLKNGGVRTWGAAVAWNALGLADLVYVLSIGILSLPSTQFVLTSYLAIILLTGVPLAIILHITSIALLTTKGNSLVFAARSVERKM